MMLAAWYKDDIHEYSFRPELDGTVWLDIIEGEKVDSLICPSIAVAYDTMIVLSTGKLYRTF